MKLDTQITKEILRTTKSHIDRLNEIGIKTISDFLHFFPRDYEINGDVLDPAFVDTSKKNSVIGVLTDIKKQRTKTGKLISKGNLKGNIGEISLVWFSAFPGSTLKIGKKYIMTGLIKHEFAGVTMMNPDFEEESDELIHARKVIPIYPETDLTNKKQAGKISSKWIREKIYKFVFMAEQISETLPDDVIKEENLMSRQEAIKILHLPENEEEIKEAQRRFAFEEVFNLQIKALNKKYLKSKKGGNAHKIKMDTELIKKFFKTLPFTFTDSQKIVLYEILKDMEDSPAMYRLLEGDVGSGKTIVVASAILNVLKSGFQCAIMAPTEILAMQHFNKFQEQLSDFVKIDDGDKRSNEKYLMKILTGSQREKEKTQIRQEIESGKIKLIVGTHSIIQEKIKFKNLGFAVIDEQHRFGVKQREKLFSHGNPHTLTMTATPIPRSLALTLYGDQDLSVITQMPKGRKKVITKVINEDKRRQTYLWIDNKIEKGEQAFVICPLIEESDKMQVKSVLQEFIKLKEKIFPHRKLTLLHGKMSGQEKNKIMDDFKKKKFDILVSTSVIEVGIDIPNATIILIESAERFGLASLHQFRGRVGRNDKTSYCFLFTTDPKIAKTKRLSAMEQTNDGFKLAKIDLHLRGPGQLFGTEQSGVGNFKFANILDANLINRAREIAQKIVFGESSEKKF